MADAVKISCEACGKQYSWKPELAGRRVKCKCGNVISVPAAQPKPGIDDLYDLVPEEPPRQAHKTPVTMIPAAIENPPIPDAPRKARPGSGGSHAAGPRTLAYAGAPTARERERVDAVIDLKRDVHVPAALLVTGLLAYIAYCMFRYHLSGSALAFVGLGLGLLTLFKAALLLGFALVVAGPLGVSFGGIFTAALKLAAIAVFCDGCTAWVEYGIDKMTGARGFFGGFISFPVSLGIYWLLLTYLFSMDPGDSWLLVVILAVFDFIVRWALAFLLIAVVLRMGGAGLPSIPTLGGGSGVPSFVGGSGPSAAASASEEDAQTATMLDELRDARLLQEARQYIADGHQMSLGKSVEDWYAAGAKNIWFTMSRDINGKQSPDELVIELPQDKEKRTRCYEILKAYDQAHDGGAGPASEYRDAGRRYLSIGIQ